MRTVLRAPAVKNIFQRKIKRRRPVKVQSPVPKDEIVVLQCWKGVLRVYLKHGNDNREMTSRNFEKLIIFVIPISLKLDRLYAGILTTITHCFYYNIPSEIPPF